VQLIARQGARSRVQHGVRRDRRAGGLGGSTLFTPYFKATGMEAKQAVGTSAALGCGQHGGAIAMRWAGRNVHISDWRLGSSTYRRWSPWLPARSDRSGGRGARAPAIGAHAVHRSASSCAPTAATCC